MKSLYLWVLCFFASYITILSCYVFFARQLGLLSLSEVFFQGIVVYVLFGVICGTLGFLTFHFFTVNREDVDRLTFGDTLLPLCVSISTTLIFFYAVFTIARSG